MDTQWCVKVSSACVCCYRCCYRWLVQARSPEFHRDKSLTVFSWDVVTTLDLCKGYWQLPLEPTSRPYTAFRTPIGLYQFTVLPFGLHGAPATFQRLMDKVLQGCEEWSAAYLDDVVIHSNSWQEHLRHLTQTLEKIKKAGLTLNVGKCEWAKQEANYLGYHLGNGQLRPQVNKVEAICQSPRPKTKKEVRSFLGLVGWYRRFIPNFASIAAPLTNLLNKCVANPIPWTEDCEAAFKTLKEKMCSSPVLQSPDFTQSFLVQVDASAKGLGAVLVQRTQGNEKPVVYLSRKLLPREYSLFSGGEGVPRHQVGPGKLTVLPLRKRVQPVDGPQSLDLVTFDEGP